MLTCMLQTCFVRKCHNRKKTVICIIVSIIISQFSCIANYSCSIISIPRRNMMSFAMPVTCKMHDYPLSGKLPNCFTFPAFWAGGLGGKTGFTGIFG